ncbi:MAG: hypothetical protein WAX89_03915 [Alphaproteobacteria bacterium]
MYVLWAALLLVLPSVGSASSAPKADAHAAPAANPTPVEVTFQPPVRDYSPAEVQLLQDLDVERIKLERRAQALELRERLVDLAEERMSAKITDMKALQTQLEALLKNASAMEDAELEQLAKVYESMKPAAAAEIMNQMDNGVVYDVFRRMKNKSVAKIMEKMSLPKARHLSEMLADEKTLPPSGLEN